MPGSVVAALMAAHLVGEARICVDKGGFDLVSDFFGVLILCRCMT